MCRYIARLCRALFVVFVCLALAGCSGDKLTKANYDKINMGMTESEVEAILGRGAEQTGGEASTPSVSLGGATLNTMSLSGKAKIWKEHEKQIMVTFVNGKAVTKSAVGLGQ